MCSLPKSLTNTRFHDQIGSMGLSTKTLFTFIFCCSLACSPESGKTSSAEGRDVLPMQVQTLREGNRVLLSIQPDAGFGIQIDAPNQLQVEGIQGLTVQSANLPFEGSPRTDKPEYFAQLKPMEIQVEGKGNLQLTGKIFYCDFSKNICLPGKLHRVLEIP